MYSELKETPSVVREGRDCFFFSFTNSWKDNLLFVNSWKDNILFVNSWKDNILFVNSWKPNAWLGHSWIEPPWKSLKTARLSSAESLNFPSCCTALNRRSIEKEEKMSKSNHHDPAALGPRSAVHQFSTALAQTAYRIFSPRCLRASFKGSYYPQNPWKNESELPLISCWWIFHIWLWRFILCLISLLTGDTVYFIHGKRWYSYGIINTRLYFRNMCLLVTNSFRNVAKNGQEFFISRNVILKPRETEKLIIARAEQKNQCEKIYQRILSY